MADDASTTAALRTYLWESAPVLALRLDAGHGVTEANAQARQLLRSELLGRPFADQIVGFTRPADVPALLRQEGVVHPLTLATAAGLPETVGFRFFPVRGGTLALGSPDFQEQQALRNQMLSLNRELNNLTRQLQQANAELKELNQLKDRFLGMAAHDLRKPIGIIMTYLDLVLDKAGPQFSAEHREFLRTSLQAATGMKELIDGFLDLAVMESGHLRLEVAPTTAGQLLTDAEAIARPLAERKKISLLVEPGDGTRRLPVDGPKLQQVLLNLIGNAVEHSRPGQRVWLGARWEEQSVVVAVRDEGPGLAPEDQARLFTAFGRAGPKKTAGKRSTGLGLAIARLIVEAHGGRIWVESQPGKGATFFCTVPAVNDAAQPPSRNAP